MGEESMAKYHINEQNIVADDELSNNIGREVCKTCQDCIFVGAGKLDGKPVPNASFCEAYANKPYAIYFGNEDVCEYKQVK